ncbi:hypothetical protein DFH27DRAFT_604971 [Peziza echinospora]|nr:hypothetical protein DFH27DRAFT_604971 [Peziza echinospora]
MQTQQKPLAGRITNLSATPRQSVPRHTDRSTMSAPDAAAPDAEATRAAQLARARYRSCLLLLAACPITAALPPRRFTVWTFGLGAVWLFALDEVLAQNRGTRPFLQHTPEPTVKPQPVQSSTEGK